jgi:ribosomal protein L37E
MMIATTRLTLKRTTRRCRTCGANVPIGTKFCTTCGNPLSARSHALADHPEHP